VEQRPVLGPKDNFSRIGQASCYFLFVESSLSDHSFSLKELEAVIQKAVASTLLLGFIRQDAQSLLEKRDCDWAVDG